MLEGQVVWHPWNFREILEGHDQLGTLGITIKILDVAPLVLLEKFLKGTTKLGTLGITIKLLRCGTLGTSREVLEGHNQAWHPWNH